MVVQTIKKSLSIFLVAVIVTLVIALFLLLVWKPSIAKVNLRNTDLIMFTQFMPFRANDSPQTDLQQRLQQFYDTDQRLLT
jgi:hypothetical protein